MCRHFIKIFVGLCLIILLEEPHTLNTESSEGTMLGIYTLYVQALLHPPPISGDDDLFHLIDEELEAQKGEIFQLGSVREAPGNHIYLTPGAVFLPLPFSLPLLVQRGTLNIQLGCCSPSFYSKKDMLFPIQQLLHLSLEGCRPGQIHCCLQ